MKIAMIVITYNDDYKFKEWCQWYEEYKDQIALYVIVDNNSKPEYRKQLKDYFKNAHIIWRKTNGGCTSAYNDGIRYALSQPDITHIALMGNDMRIGKNCLQKCVELLDSEEDLGMVSPVVLCADSDIVGDFGCGIGDDLTMVSYVSYTEGKRLLELKENWRYCDCVQGGTNIAKRSFYEKVGLQDENLFMYSDEVDMALRAKKCGIKMAATREGQTWHQHIVPPLVVKRHPYSAYLKARNKVYLSFKHFGKRKARIIFNDFFYGALKHYLINVVRFNFDKAQSCRWRMIGAWKGLKGDMRENSYSHL